MAKQSKEKQKNKESVTTHEAANILGVGYHKARRMLLEDGISHYLYGREKLWLLSEVIAFKERHFVKQLGVA